MRPPAPKGLRPGEKAQVADGRNQLPAVDREQRADAGIQRAEGGGQEAEVGGQRTEVGGRRTEVVGRRTEVAGRRTEVGGPRTEVTRQKTVPKSLKTAAVKKVAATGRPMAGDKSRKMDVREQRAKTIGPQRSRPSAPLNQTPQDRKQPAEIKKQKRKVTI